MSASGKSSNRKYEYHRGYYGGGHGIYAAQGRRDAETIWTKRDSGIGKFTEAKKVGGSFKSPFRKSWLRRLIERYKS